jgi:hypothetical protein
MIDENRARVELRMHLDAVDENLQELDIEIVKLNLLVLHYDAVDEELKNVGARFDEARSAHRDQENIVTELVKQRAALLKERC